MPTLRLATSRQTRNPVRVQQWNASIRAGDDLKLALTVYNDDSGTLAPVAGSFARLSLFADHRGGIAASPDYGLGWFTGGSVIGGPLLAVDGIVVSASLPGRINFYMPGATTRGLWWGRYRLAIQVDLYDGESSAVEGVMQVREPWFNIATLGHTVRTYFQADRSQLDAGIDGLAPLLNDAGLPVDADGFPV